MDPELRLHAGLEANLSNEVGLIILDILALFCQRSAVSGSLTTKTHNSYLNVLLITGTTGDFSKGTASTWSDRWLVSGINDTESIWDAIAGCFRVAPKFRQNCECHTAQLSILSVILPPEICDLISTHEWFLALVSIVPLCANSCLSAVIRHWRQLRPVAVLSYTYLWRRTSMPLVNEISPKFISKCAWLLLLSLSVSQ